MKFAYLSILFLYLILHILGPFAFYSLFGYEYRSAYLIDLPSIYKAVALNSIGTILAGAIIWILPENNKKIEPKFDYAHVYFYLAIIMTVVNWGLVGGFQNAISGKSMELSFRFIPLFFSISVFPLVLIFNRNTSLLWGSSFIVVYTVASGSRSFLVQLIFIFIIMSLGTNFLKYKKRYLKILLVVFLLTPILFLAANFTRTLDYKGFLESKTRVSNHTLTNPRIQEEVNLQYLKAKSENLIRDIVLTVSHLENASLPIYLKDNNISESRLSFFYQKHDLAYQAKLMINSLVPGSIFKNDVCPNQYYRYIFRNDSLESVKQYVSLNMTLPTYYYMYLGGVFSIVLFVLTIVALYLFTSYLYKKIPILSLPILSTFYTLLFFFDWTDYYLLLAQSVRVAIVFWIMASGLQYLMPKLKDKLNFFK